MLYPLTFNPLFQERIWGGRKLEELYRKKLPTAGPIGESWEISDRPGQISIVNRGPLQGKSLRWLMENHGRDLLGWVPTADERFPLLVKLLDSREKLSLQVHPPAQKAAALGGEPKTEMWYIANAETDAELFVGLKTGTTRAEFEDKIRDGSVADCFSRIKVRSGDAMFLPSGRVHAIGGGVVIFEIQQNSDTTYRVFDWNRLDSTGKPRQLHVRESLDCIDFNDFEPGLIQAEFHQDRGVRVKSLVQDVLFNVDLFEMKAGDRVPLEQLNAKILAVVAGSLTLSTERDSLTLGPGEVCLLPHAASVASIEAEAPAQFLKVEIPNAGEAR
jgi:mannose-6-phosphate isomerase